jgi:hypothetical protein
MSGEDAPRPYLENLIVLEIKTNKQSTNWLVEWPAHLVIICIVAFATIDVHCSRVTRLVNNTGQ